VKFLHNIKNIQLIVLYVQASIGHDMILLYCIVEKQWKTSTSVYSTTLHLCDIFKNYVNIWIPENEKSPVARKRFLNRGVGGC